MSDIFEVCDHFQGLGNSQVTKVFESRLRSILRVISILGRSIRFKFTFDVDKADNVRRPTYGIILVCKLETAEFPRNRSGLVVSSVKLNYKALATILSSSKQHFMDGAHRVCIYEHLMNVSL